MKTKIFTLLAVLTISSYSNGQVINVPGDQPSIQAGIDEADDGDIVLVAQGTYFENINFDGKAITVMSNYQNSMDSTDIYNTIIDGNQNGSVVYFTSEEDTTSILSGFTIRNGSGTYPDSWGDHSGGGIICEYSGAKIIHNLIIDNIVSNNASAVYGAGVCASSDGNHTLIMRDNIIAYNELNTLGNPNMASGGGIFIYSMNHTIQNNLIEDNFANGKWARGAGLTTNNSTGIVNDNEIINNEIYVITATGMGGGIHVRDPGPGLTITQNTIEENICTGDGNYYGGGIGVINWGDNSDYHIDGNIIEGNNAMSGGGIFFTAAETGCFITNNVIRDNEAEVVGGGIYCFESSGKDEMYDLGMKRTNSLELTGSLKSDLVPQIINNTIINNTAISGGGGIFNWIEDNNLVAINNIISGNEADQGSGVYTENGAFITYLYYNNIDTDLIYGDWEGGNNELLDPEFEDDGYHLSEDSECIDMGIDLLEIDGDTYYCPEVDIDGDERPYFETLVDIGADEYKLISRIAKRLYSNKNYLQNFPNPFAKTTTIKFELKYEIFIDLSIYDLSGTKIVVLLSENLQAGMHEIKMDAGWLENGIYFCVLKTNEGMQTKKIIKL